MKAYLWLFFSSLLLLVTTSYFTFNFDKNNFAGADDIYKLNLLKREFTEATSPVVEIDFNDLYQASELFQISLASGTVSKSLYSSPCSLVSPVNSNRSDRILNKREIWEEYRCKKRKDLPQNFFDIPPYMHESGKSYAMLALTSGIEQFNNPDWVYNNLSHFHVLELDELPKIKLGDFEFLKKLDADDLITINSNRDDIITMDFFLYKIPKGRHTAYKFYDSKQFDDFLKKKGYSIFYNKDEICFFKQDNFCIEKSPGYLINLFRQYSLLIFIPSLIVLFFVAMIIYKRIKQQRFEEESKRHALRVLTHELRTPIANLLLMVERISKDSTVLPAHVQEDVLKMESEIYRLKRLAEKSSSYIKSHDGHQMIAFHFQKIESINELMAELVAPYLGTGLKFIPSMKDGPFALDVYWVQLCLKNLIENAVAHGKWPVVVVIDLLGSELHVTVQDNGATDARKIEDLISRKWSANNSGLGLGLSIVSSIMKEMGGKLLFENEPTTFTLVFRNKA